MAKWMWASFADKDGFRGAAIVQAEDVEDAADVCWRKGINPGGEVRAVYVDVARVPDSYKNRLLNRKESLELKALLESPDRRQ